MSEKFRLDRKIRFQNTFYTKCINVIIDSIGPSIILRSIYSTHRRVINGLPAIRHFKWRIAGGPLVAHCCGLVESIQRG